MPYPFDAADGVAHDPLGAKDSEPDRPQQAIQPEYTSLVCDVDGGVIGIDATPRPARLKAAAQRAITLPDW